MKTDNFAHKPLERITVAVDARRKAGEPEYSSKSLQGFREKGRAMARKADQTLGRKGGRKGQVMRGH